MFVATRHHNAKGTAVPRNTVGNSRGPGLPVLRVFIRSLRAVLSPACLFLVSGACIASCSFAASPASGSIDGAIAFGTWIESSNPNSQNPAPTQGSTPQQTPPQKPQQPPPQPQQQNPFENVPAPPEKSQPTPAPTTPPPGGISEAKPATIEENIVEEVQFRGQRKVPQDTLRGLIFTKKGDVYDDAAVHRDFMSLWNSGRFDDLRVEKEKGPNGGVISASSSPNAALFTPSTTPATSR